MSCFVDTSKSLNSQACTNCGEIFTSYSVECKHYTITHDQSVLMCSYCQNEDSLLAEHVLASHTEDVIIPEPVSACFCLK